MRKIYNFNEDKLGFSLKLKQLMAENGYTIESLADELGYDINTIKKWRAGERTPDIDMINSLAKIFRVSMQELYLPNSIYEDQISDDLNEIITKKNRNIVFDKKTIKKINSYCDYLFQKMLFSFIDLKEQVTLDSLFRFFKVTDYGFRHLSIENNEVSFPVFFSKVRRYIEKQYGLSFPYKNNMASKMSLLKEFDKWIEPLCGGNVL